MGFLAPKVPKPAPGANPAQAASSSASANLEELGLANTSRSLVSTSSQGLKRKENTQRTSLVGG